MLIGRSCHILHCEAGPLRADLSSAAVGYCAVQCDGNKGVRCKQRRRKSETVPEKLVKCGKVEKAPEYWNVVARFLTSHTTPAFYQNRLSSIQSPGSASDMSSSACSESVSWNYYCHPDWRVDTVL